MNEYGRKNAGTNDHQFVAGKAEQWFARLLDPDCTAVDRQAFERWRATSPAHADAYRQVEKLWATSEEAIKSDPALMVTAQRALHPPKAWFSHRWIVPASAAVAIIVVALLLVPVWLFHSHAPAGTEYRTTIGQQKTISLKDGTRIVLDTHSEVRVRYNAHTRRVDLLRGRAQFHVHANPQRPFVVHARAGTVTDIGTTFQISLEKHRVNVTLLEGRVTVFTQVDGKTRHAALAPGQQLDFNRNGAISPVHKANLELAKGWTSGKLFVHDWPLSKLLDALNRYNTTQMVIGDPSLRHLHISGVFHVNDQKTLLLALEQGWSLKAVRTDTGQIVLSRK